MVSEHHAEHFLRSVEALCELGIPVLALAEGDAESQKICFELSKAYPTMFTLLESVNRNRSTILKQSEVLVFPSAPSDALLKEIIEAEIVPVMPKRKGFENFDPQAEKGNAFLYEEGNFWKFLSAILRASENFKFEYDWENLKKSLKDVKL